MSARNPPIRKVTISLPADLVDFADQQAVRLSISRSGVIAQALQEIQAEEEGLLAAEGYRFYSRESSEFAEDSASAAAEAWEHAG
jgi:metal-responsive CopG/Arc/MetJ family transcriptional regulator